MAKVKVPMSLFIFSTCLVKPFDLARICVYLMDMPYVSCVLPVSAQSPDFSHDVELPATQWQTTTADSTEQRSSSSYIHAYCRASTQREGCAPFQCQTLAKDLLLLLPDHTDVSICRI